jgi:hypothetical protein
LRGEEPAVDRRYETVETHEVSRPLVPHALWKANHGVYGSRKLRNAVRRSRIDIGRDPKRVRTAEQDRGATSWTAFTSLSGSGRTRRCAADPGVRHEEVAVGSQRVIDSLGNCGVV